MAFKNEETYDRLVHQGNDEAFHTAYEAAASEVLGNAGGASIDYPNHIDGKPCLSGKQFTDRSPGDERIVVGLFQSSSREEVAEAIRSSQHAFLTWSREDWKDRVRIFQKAADIMRRQKYMVAAAITLDNGKNRYEAVADVDEGIDFLDYYCAEMRRNDGYERSSNPPYAEEEVEVLLRPYGTWAVICPFNFPLAITVGMTTGVLITGNTAVLKPSSTAPLPVHLFYEIMAQAGVPDGVLNLVAGSGGEVGDALANSPEIDGVVFTGSRQVGLGIMRNAPLGAQRPVIAEMGSKNPIIVSGEADLEKAAAGVVASAFGYSGQKCSACSRVYVHRSVYTDFMDRLVDLTKELKVGDPFRRDTSVGPVITRTALENYMKWMEMASRHGKVLVGGSRVTDGELAHGYYVQPTIVSDLPPDHELIKKELFVPILCALPYDTMPEALEMANSTEFGLTAGIFTENEVEMRYFFDNIEFGVVYANRRRGGSTGKGTGSTHYLPQFLREQSRTISR